MIADSSKIAKHLRAEPLAITPARGGEVETRPAGVTATHIKLKHAVLSGQTVKSEAGLIVGRFPVRILRSICQCLIVCFGPSKLGRRLVVSSTRRASGVSI
jgi:hypothetical protein